jgi:hypothetical protein
MSRVVEMDLMQLARERTLASAPTGAGWMVSGVRVAGNALWRVRLRGGFEAVFGLHDPG